MKAVALLAEAAEENGDFWAMHDLLFRSQPSLDTASLKHYGAQFGMNEKLVRDALRGAYQQRVANDFLSGVRSGVNGTPTFLIEGERYDGNWEEAILIRALQLAARKPDGSANRSRW